MARSISLEKKLGRALLTSLIPLAVSLGACTSGPVPESDRTVLAVPPVELPPEPVGPDFMVGEGLAYDPVRPTTDGPALRWEIERTLSETRARIGELNELKNDETRNVARLDRHVGYLTAWSMKLIEEAEELDLAGQASNVRERERVEAVEAVNELRESLAKVERAVN